MSAVDREGGKEGGGPSITYSWHYIEFATADVQSEAALLLPIAGGEGLGGWEGRGCGGRRHDHPVRKGGREEKRDY